jgi:hypothetical protein
MAVKKIVPGRKYGLDEAVQLLTQQYESQAEAAREFGINKTYWSRMMAGIKDNPSDDTLARMGLTRVPAKYMFNES